VTEPARHLRIVGLDPDTGEIHEVDHACPTGKRGKWSTDRFWIVHPYLADDGLELCKLAIVGATFDPWISTRKNGTKNLHVDWSWIFKDRDRFEEHVRKAPLEVRAQLLKDREERS
jgi:hypothetical protein